MIYYFFKKSIFERWIHQSAKKLCLQIVEQFWNNIPQCKNCENIEYLSISSI